MLNRYRKSVAALVSAVAGWGLASSADSVYTQQEWWGLGILLAGVVAVWGIPNDAPAGEAADPRVSERGIALVELLLIVVLALVAVALVVYLFDVDFRG